MLPLTAPSIPAALEQLMSEVGPVWGTSVQTHVKLMVDSFSKLLVDAPKLAKVTRNVSYGSDPRNVVDIYEPIASSTGATPWPVVLFVHGGAFVEGEKDRTDEIYSNVAWFFARHGVLTVNVEYRLAPQHRFPAGTLDVASVVDWMRRNASLFGGDPSRIFLMGHSAGGAHAAHYAYDKSFHPSHGHGLAGLIVVSGRVRAEDSAENPNAERIRAYYPTAAHMEQGSAVNFVSGASLATMIAVAQFENPLIDVHCVELFNFLTRCRRRAPRFVWLSRHNHTSSVAHFNTADVVLGHHILDFIGNPQ